jgi:hypothetical protein
MKKILGGILLIIVLWATTTAVIGIKTEKEIEKIVEKTNKIYAEQGIKINLEKYQNSFFSAVATVKIDMLDSELKKSISKEYGLLFPIKTEYQIEHGPLFFKNGIALGLSRIYQDMEVSSLFNQEVKERFTKKSMMVSKTVVSFSQIASYHLLGERIEIQEGAKKLDIAPFEIRGESSLEDFTGEMQMVMPLLSFAEGDRKVTIESMLLDINMDKMVSNSLAMGQIDLSMKRFYLADKENGAIDVIPTLHILSQKDGEKTFGSIMELNMDFNNTTTQPSLSDIEKLNLMVKVDGVGIKGMQEYQEAMKKVQEKQAKVMMELQTNPNNKEENYQKLVALQEEMGTHLLDALKDMLFKDKTSITYRFKSQTKDKKESHGDILLGYTGDIDFSKTAQEIRQRVNADMFSLFKLEVDIAIAESHLQTLPDGDELLKQLQAPMSQTMVNHRNNYYTIKGYLKNQELVLNDENLTHTVLPLLKMLTQLAVAP